MQFDLWRNEEATGRTEDKVLKAIHHFVNEYTCYTPADMKLLEQAPSFTTIDVPVRVYHGDPVSRVGRASFELTMVFPERGRREEDSGYTRIENPLAIKGQ